jgi:hypothetical protein
MDADTLSPLSLSVTPPKSSAKKFAFGNADHMPRGMSTLVGQRFVVRLPSLSQLTASGTGAVKSKNFILETGDGKERGYYIEDSDSDDSIEIILDEPVRRKIAGTRRCAKSLGLPDPGSQRTPKRSNQNLGVFHSVNSQQGQSIEVSFLSFQLLCS